MYVHTKIVRSKRGNLNPKQGRFLAPMTLNSPDDLDLTIRNMYLQTKNELSRSRLSKISLQHYKQTDRQTVWQTVWQTDTHSCDRTRSTAHSRV